MAKEVKVIDKTVGEAVKGLQSKDFKKVVELGAFVIGVNKGFDLLWNGAKKAYNYIATKVAEKTKSEEKPEENNTELSEQNSEVN